MIVDIEIVGVRANENECESGLLDIAFTIFWQKNTGEFGEIDIRQSTYKDRKTQFLINSEFMSREFVKEVLAAIVDKAYIE